MPRTYHCRPLAERFWEKVIKTNTCWLWNACFHRNSGYGSFGISRSITDHAHRIAWILTYGPIPEGLFICHKCDNRLCVRPDHLFAGTQKDNLQDMKRKGRGTIANRGAGSGKTKLTDIDVANIRKLSAVGLSMAEIGRRYTMAGTSISRIVHRKRWKYG